MRKLGMLTCTCGKPLRVTGARVVCEACERSASRNEAEFCIHSIAAERSQIVDQAGIQADERQRLVFFFTEKEAASAD